MRRIFAISTLLSALCTFQASAILDTNNNGLSDLWERAYNGGDLFPIDVYPYRPGDDSDGDGWTNEQEAAADTNPFDPNPPDGLIRPDIVHIPAVWIDTDFDEIPDTISTSEAVTITWSTIVGKQYTLLYSPDLVEWLSVPDETFIGKGSLVSYNYTLDENTKLFWRVKIEDVDSDGDGLTDAEEYKLGFDPQIADYDGDGLNDLQEYLLGTNPRLSDTDGDGIPDNLDSNPLLAIPTFPDADGDGIPDSSDTAPNTPRGAPPTITSQTASRSAIVNIMKGEPLTFLLTVENPAGQPVSASNLQLFIGGVPNAAAFSQVGANQYAVTWNAQTNPNYPNAILQSITVRFQDSENATAWLDLGLCDVAEWEGMIAGFWCSIIDSPVFSPLIGTHVVSHYSGLKQPPQCLTGDGSSCWYRGPKAIPIVDQSSVAIGVTAQIGNERYPLFMISRSSSGTYSVEQTCDISNPIAYPHNGVFYNNSYSSAVTMSSDLTESLQINPGEIKFQPLPEAPEFGGPNIGVVGTGLLEDEQVTLYSSVWTLIKSNRSYRKYCGYLITTESENYPSLGLFNDLGYLRVGIDVRMIPYTAGSLEYPGLPIGLAQFPQGPGGQYENWKTEPILPIQSEQWHKVVLKVGPDAGALSAGIRLSIGSGENGQSAPQDGFTIRVQTAGSFSDLPLADGKCTMNQTSDLYNALISPSGLTLFLKRSSAVDVIHRLSLDLMPRMPSYEFVQIDALDLLPVDLAVDADRDGEITFDGKDKTTPEKPFRFWINDDVDKGNTVDANDYEEDDLNESAKDSDDGKLNFRRDLEDLTRLWIDFSGIASVFPASDPTVVLKVRVEAVNGNPAINLYQPVETDGGREYLKNEDTGYNQLQGIYGQELCKATSTAAVVPRRAWETLPSDKVIHLLFEGAQEGDGKLIFEIWKDGTKLCDLPPVDLSLKKAKDMYETWTVGDVDAPGVNFTAWPASSATQTSGQSIPAPENTEEKDYIMFVHGWNMPPWEKETFASTMFKRMWHQGYKGRFGAFRWPTFHGLSTDAPKDLHTAHFDGSEQRAWNSASALKNLLIERESEFGTNKIRLYAHSMGNIVSSEALRQMAPSSHVNTYISAQAAISSHVWDKTTPRMTFNSPFELNTPNVYGYYWQSTAALPPHNWENEGRPSYMDPQYMPSGTTYINHYNPLDWALSYDYWQLNQVLKPDVDYNYGWPALDFIDISLRFWKTQSIPPFRNLIFPNDRFEVFSYAAQSHGYAAGQQGATGGMFNVARSVNLFQAFDFESAHKGHSAQFRSTIQKRWTYWKKALEDMKINLPE